MSIYYRIVLTILDIKYIPASWLSIAISANKDIMKAYPFLLALCRNLISFCYRIYINPKCVTHQVIPCLWGLISFHSHILCQLLKNQKYVCFFICIRQLFPTIGLIISIDISTFQNSIVLSQRQRSQVKSLKLL